MKGTKVEEMLPALVYGTLRPGQSNYRYLLEGNTVYEQDVTIKGYRMHSNSGFPYVIPSAEEESITGTLVYIPEEKYAEVLQDLDWLEGYAGPDMDNHYDRIVVNVDLGDEVVKAWMYVAHNSRRDYITQCLPVVEGGDWVQFVEAQRELRRNANRTQYTVGSSFYNV